MDAVIRAAATYLFLLLIFRISGKRTLAQITTFDLVLVLIVSEATQNALLGDNASMTHAFVLITSLVSIDILLAIFKQKWPQLDRWIEGVPLVIVEDGQPLLKNMRYGRVDESDVLTAAREYQGITKMNQITLAVLERNGRISIVPSAQSLEKGSLSQGRCDET